MTDIPTEIPEVGQMWRDTDERSKGSGEFTIVALWGGHGATGPGPIRLHERASESDKTRAHGVAERAIDRTTKPFVVALRKGGRMSRIRLDRLTGRGYEYMGRAR